MTGTSAVGPFLRLLSLGDVAAIRFKRYRALSIELYILHPLVWHVDVGKDRLDRAFGAASITIKAVERIDVKHRFVLVEALCRAHDYAIGVLAIVTRLANDVRHGPGILLGEESIERPALSYARDAPRQPISFPFARSARAGENCNLQVRILNEQI